MFSNRLIYLFLFIVATLAVYRVSSGQAPLVENWGWTMVPMSVKTDVVTPQGQSNSDNNQSQLFYNQNEIINTSLLSNRQRNLLASNLMNPMKTTLMNEGTRNLRGRRDSDIEDPSVEITNYNVSENYDHNRDRVSQHFPVYTVPGTYQADLSPRFNPNGLNGYVKYNIPQEDHLANRSQDPLMMSTDDDHSMTSDRSREKQDASLRYAHMVEKPKVKEDFTMASATPQQEDEMQQRLIDQGTDIQSKLPVTPMNYATGNEKPDVYYNTDRFIFSLQKSRLYGQGDFIRGDIPVIPCNPNRNPYSQTWFRPSVTPRYDLNAGAMGVIGGVGNVSNQQTLELMSRSTGGATSVINGVSTNVVDTPVYNQAAMRDSQYKTYQMGNSFDQVVDTANPPSTVITTAFP